MPIIYQVWRALQAVPPEVRQLVGELVLRIVRGEDPKTTTRRLLEEEARLRMFDEAMRRSDKF